MQRAKADPFGALPYQYIAQYETDGERSRPLRTRSQNVYVQFRRPRPTSHGRPAIPSDSYLMSHTLRTIRLELPTIEHLFVDPAFSVRHAERPARSGVEQAARCLKSHGRGTPVQVLVALDDPPTPDALDAAVAAWPLRCRTLAREHRQNAAAMRQAGRLALVLGLALMVLCMAIAAAATHFEPFPRLLNRLLEDGLIILGWVALWRPLDLLLFDGTAELRNARLYERLAESNIEVAR